MTTQEQYVYNCYLEISRKINNQPFKYRKDFEGFEEREDYVYVARLTNFFNRFPNINIKDFLEAPYFVYNEKHFDLKFFTTQKAIKAYTNYETNFLPNNPDHNQTVKKIKDSFLYIFKFCQQRKTKFEDYILVKEENESLHSFLIHLKERNTILYPLFTFPKFDTTLATYDKDIKNLMFGTLFDNINFYRTKYYASNKARKLCITIFELLKNKQPNI
jgi:hypothetical protein